MQDMPTLEHWRNYFNFVALSNFLMGRRAACLLYTSDAADERSSVDLGGRRIIKKKNSKELSDKSITM